MRRYAFLGVILAGALLVSASPVIAKSDDGRVVSAAAIKVAQQFLVSYAPAHRPAWMGAVLTDPVLYETPKGKPDSYVVSVKDKTGTTSLGYMLIGATKAHSPIMENSTGPVPNSNVPAAKELAASQGYSTEHMRLVHGGPAVFLAEFKDSRHAEPLVINLRDLKPAPMKYFVEPGVPSAQAVTQASDQWQRLSNGTSSGGVGVMIVTSNQIANFPISMNMSLTKHPNNGCGPVAGAAIYTWYANYGGYPNVGTYDWVDLVDILYNTMQTGFFGTDPTQWANGMRIRANDQAHYNFTTQAVDSKTSDYWYTFKSEINSNHPTGVYIGQNLATNDTFEYHIMAAYGYYHDSNIAYRQIDVATGWSYASSFDYDYYRARYPFSFMWVRPG